MSRTRRVFDIARARVNRYLDLDLVRASGHHTLRTHIPTVLHHLSVSTVVDVGSNEGHFGVTLRELGFTGRIVSFEPVQAAFQVLKQRADRDGNWTAHHCALGSYSGETTINVSRFSQFSSILPPTEYGRSWENMVVESQETVRLRTIDECLKDGTIPDDPRIMLKMDTQGFDLEVFKGASETLRNVACILSEISLIPIYEGMPHYIESLSVYESNGYRVSGFYPITRRKLSLNEVDCMMVRASLEDDIP